VTTQSGCAWTSSTGAVWITLSASGTGSGTGTYTIPANTGSTTRSATIYVSGVAISVIQNPTTTTNPAMSSPNNLRIIK
jgi:hypothetical protein